MKLYALTLTSAAAALLAAALAASAATLPPEQRVGDVAFVTGGVGDDESAAFKQAMAAYPLAIEVVRSNAGRGEYTSGATVQVSRRSSGTVVLSTKAEGPFVLARVPPGDYQVQATLNGRTMTKDVSVGGNGSTRAVLSFAGD
ncbi:MAG TPA: carboxypeptidase regulatory-like domain-containing protein [Albitalea sp.]|jgi:hypothetical protein|nr:carboxypeptidase regulatory-like domain-containing protein [Albitalea sp.]